jgi:ligand-binding SRPBCC domain-containing protein
METGALIDYRLRLHGIPLKWRTEITAWEPPRRFVDTQVKGPYRLWVHEHLFQEKDGGTMVIDDVAYRPWGGRLIDRLLVRPDVERIFQFREEKMKDLFPGPE